MIPGSKLKKCYILGLLLRGNRISFTFLVRAAEFDSSVRARAAVRPARTHAKKGTAPKKGTAISHT